MANLSIREVVTKKDLKAFIKFSWKIYKKDTNWVPPIISEFINLFSDKNPFWKHADKKLFLLFEDSKIVGRVAGIIDYNYIDFQNEKAGFFGFYESYNNLEYTKNLLEAVKKWLNSKGMVRIYGPMNPSTNDEMGFFYEGDKGSPMLMMPYNPLYYIKLMEESGLEKAKDLYAYKLDYKDVNIARLKSLKKKLEKRLDDNDVNIRQIDMHNISKEVEFALDVYNEAWEKNWGFVPWTQEEFYAIVNDLKKLADPRLVLFLEVDNKPAGMLVAVPDYNQVIKKLNGKLDLIGLLKFLWHKGKIDQARLMILGVKKQYRKKGYELLLYLVATENSLDTRIKFYEFSWILEDNILTQRASEMMGAKLYRKYRVYKSEDFRGKEKE
ncbi:hypothetical protein ACFL5N_02780 [bacterium]